LAQKDLKMFTVLPRRLDGVPEMHWEDSSAYWGHPRVFKRRRMAYKGRPVAFVRHWVASLVARRLQDVHCFPRTLVGLLGTPEGTPSKGRRKAFIRRRMAYKGRPAAFIRRYRCPSVVARRYQDVHWLSVDTGRSSWNAREPLQDPRRPSGDARWPIIQRRHRTAT